MSRAATTRSTSPAAPSRATSQAAAARTNARFIPARAISIYTGSFSDFDGVEIKSGGVSFFGASTYTGTTTISGGTLIAANSTGSATGNGAVRVTGGTLGGNGSIAGAVSIGGAVTILRSGSAALAPGASGQPHATLAIQNSLTFQTGGTYLYSFNANRNNSRADEVIANGVTIAGSATLAVHGQIDGRLPVGTTFPVISNTATTPIAGTFANLPHGSIITIQGNRLRASYDGGDGNNDLQLRVVP
jgi:autotransporter-associated beta strand protein